MVGTWDGEALTLTELPRTPDRSAPRSDDENWFPTPCPAPDSGWGVVEEATATEEAMHEAIAYAQSQPEVGGVWVDQSINPAAQDGAVDERAMNDPAELVLNLSFTGGLERHEAAVRVIWGGALCVSEASISAAELAGVRAEVEDEVGDFVSSWADEATAKVQIVVLVDDGLQERFNVDSLRQGPDSFRDERSSPRRSVRLRRQRM